MSKPKKTARLIITYRCNRSCPGCCNGHGNSVRNIENIKELLEYEEIIITGGEPMLLGEDLHEFIHALRYNHNYAGRIYLYTAFFKAWNTRQSTMLAHINGITYTIHAESSDADIFMLKKLSELSTLGLNDFSSRLIIDSRVYKKYDFSNIDLTNWDVIRKLQWKEDCKPAENEELLYFPLDGRFYDKTIL